MLFSRPEAEELYVERTTVDSERCPECGGADIKAYPALRSTGWQLVTRCQECLATLHTQDPPTPFGFTYLPYSAYLRGF